MKFYRPLFLALIEGLKTVIEDQKVASKVLEALFKNNKKWGSKDRKLFAESFYEIVKWQLLIKKIVFQKFNSLGSNPDWDWCVVFYLTQKGFKLEEMFDSVSNKKYEDLIAFSKKVKLQNLGPEFNHLTIYERFSFPENLHQIVMKELENTSKESSPHSEESNFELSQMNAIHFYEQSQLEAPLFVRANLHLTTVEKLQNELALAGYSTQRSKSLPFGLLFDQKVNVFKSDSFKLGHFEVQDGGSQLISEFLQVEPGQFIIDACAGGGGKTLHLSNLSQNKGRILSMDVHSWKLEELKKRARRNQCHNIETRTIESTKVIKRLKDKADRLLLDVPCTGSGVFRRNPDAKYKWSEQGFNEILNLQAKILNEYSSMVKVQGKLVYSTCSVFKSENQKQIQKFLEVHPEWQLEEEKNIFVGENQFDGYYMSRLKRTH